MASQQLSGCQDENRRRQVFQSIAAKLNQYYKYEQLKPPRFKQPAAYFLNAFRIFDTSQAYFLCFYTNLLKAIPGWQQEHVYERAAYLNYVKELQMPAKVTELWDSLSDRFPCLYKLAKRCLTIPVNCAERAISMYGQVFTPQRQRMSAATAGGCCMLTFNK